MSGRTFRKFLFPRRHANGGSAPARLAGALSPRSAGATSPRFRRGEVTAFHRCLALHMVCAERTGALS